jgi:thioredoxin reductase (NADPH)
VLVRGPSLAASMSRYLIDRLDATPNIELHPYTELVRLHGEPATGLAGATWHDRQLREEHDCPARNIFLFVGAEPETQWLEGCGVAVDPHGFVLTGTAALAGLALEDAHVPSTLETSVPGVFAVGDVRSGSVKRVGGAIGEGAAAVASIHQRLSRTQAVA